jgi:two-component system response regulator YesN
MSEIFSVLIVDDSLDMAESLRDVLEVKGFVSHAAHSGKEALLILQNHPIDLLLTDVIMPEMNGVELYREVKKTYPKLTTYFMTAYAADDLIQQGYTSGVRTFLTKPLDINLLLTFLRAVNNLTQ